MNINRLMNNLTLNGMDLKVIAMSDKNNNINIANTTMIPYGIMNKYIFLKVVLKNFLNLPNTNKAFALCARCMRIGNKKKTKNPACILVITKFAVNPNIRRANNKNEKFKTMRYKNFLNVNFSLKIFAQIKPLKKLKLANIVINIRPVNIPNVYNEDLIS